MKIILTGLLIGGVAWATSANAKLGDTESSYAREFRLLRAAAGDGVTRMGAGKTLVYSVTVPRGIDSLRVEFFGGFSRKETYSLRDADALREVVGWIQSLHSGPAHKWREVSPLPGTNDYHKDTTRRNPDGSTTTIRRRTSNRRETIETVVRDRQGVLISSETERKQLPEETGLAVRSDGAETLIGRDSTFPHDHNRIVIRNKGVQ